MQRIVTKYGTAAHLAFLAVAPLFLSPAVQFWLCGLGLVWLLMEPSRVGGESLSAARRRSLSGLVRDPLLWVFVLVLAYAVLRLANGGVALAYDPEARVWSLAAPRIPELPGSVAESGWAELSGLTSLAVTVLGLRHTLGKAARCAALALASTVAGVVALVWTLQLPLGSEEALGYAKGVLTNPVFWGSVFGIYLVVGLAVLPDVLSRRWHALSLAMLFAISGTGAGLFLFSPPVLALLWAAIALLTLLYGVVFACVTSGPAYGLKVLAVSLIGLAAATLLVLKTAPAALVREKTTVIEECAFVPEGFLHRREILDRASEAMWRTRSWTGVGLGAYPLALKFHAQPEDWEFVPDEQQTALNGCWTLLSERGIVGAFALALPMLLFLLTYLRRLFGGLTKAFPSPVALFGLLVPAALAAESLVAVTAFTPAALTAAAFWLSVSAYSFPKEKTNG